MNRIPIATDVCNQDIWMGVHWNHSLIFLLIKTFSPFCSSQHWTFELWIDFCTGTYFLFRVPNQHAWSLFSWGNVHALNWNLICNFLPIFSIHCIYQFISNKKLKQNRCVQSPGHKNFPRKWEFSWALAVQPFKYLPINGHTEVCINFANNPRK